MTNRSFAKQTEMDYSPFTTHNSLKSTAFTLAEVLITLGIIGVVAAMTIPTLIGKYQMKQFEVAFKKQYSVLNNTINFLTMEQGLRECYVTLEYNDKGGYYSSKSSDCSALKEGIISKLKLTPLDLNDVALYSTNKDIILANGGVAVNDSVTYNAYKSYLIPYLLADGTIIWLPKQNVPTYWNTACIIDVNGKKGPNKWGYDAFWLTLNKKNDGIRLTDEYASIAEKGGKLPRTILMNKDKNDDGRPSQVWK